MGTMIDYLREYGDYTFSEKPLNEVDSLVLSQFAYLKFDGLVPWMGEDAPAVSLEALDAHPDRDKRNRDGAGNAVFRSDLFFGRADGIRGLPWDG